MTMIPFYVVYPELAALETRVVNVLVPHQGVPAGAYGLVELYCPDPSCDCRRVMLSIVEVKRTDRAVASINYGFDRNDEMAGPFLDPLNRQGTYAEALLDLIKATALQDASYVRRLERHYRLVKQAAADPQHPAYKELQEALTGGVTSFPVRGVRKGPARRRRPGKRK